ncbi:MAG TPA: PQQ-binding-like beta-propeller repeat protein [Bryobacteraceae bacterium]|nr:PQQ-binding-like beta-propeller repeat protein [Bryobacteraceae bacterium]
METVMKRRHFIPLLAAPLLPRSVVSAPANPPEWPQWRGPERSGVSSETGLAKSWPSAGPRALWSISNLGEGYGSLAIKGDRVYVQGVARGESAVFCLDRSNGKTVWTTALAERLEQDRGSGPRGTPTLDGEHLYALAENGELACLRARDGDKVWRLNMLHEFHGRNPHWLISESPLVDGDRLIVTPGGSGACIVALEKTSGKTVWTSRELSDGAGYSSCIIADVQGVSTIMALTDHAGVGVRATDGKAMWRYERAANRTANIATPVFHDNKVFYTSDYGTGGGLLGLTARNGEVKAEEIYFSREMQNHHGGVVFHDGYLFGYSNSILTCMEFSTGKVAWKDRSVGKGSLTLADGRLYLLSEDNVAGLAEATPESYREKGRFSIADQGRPSWAHPVVCGGQLYLRNQGMLTCYDVRG